MSQQSENPVYVSYSRTEEKQNGTVSKMQKELQDIDFQIDTEQVKYRDNFMNYIAMIGQADYIVLVFSEAYLKSFYCMYELTKIIQYRGDIKQRVFPIRNENFDLNDTAKQNIIIDYWQQVFDAGTEPRPEGFTKNGSVAEVKEIQSQLKAIFDQFSTIHAPTASELVPPTFKLLFNDSYKAIREWLKEAKPEAVLAGKKKLSDKKFTFNVEKQITAILKRFPVLHTNLIEEFENIDNERELAKILCINENQAELLAYTLLGPCKQAVESCRQKESNEHVHALKSDIRQLLNCLCVMAINPDWVIKQSGSQQQVMLIPVATSLGEIATAGRLGQVIPNMSVGPENNFTSKYEMSPFKQGTWDNETNLAVEAILCFIFHQVFDIPQLRGNAMENGIITEGQRIQLNTQIKLNALDGSRHYYCMLREKEIAPQFLNDPKLIEQLKIKLPALDIFKLQDTMGNIALLAADEHELSQTYHHFLTQIEQW